MQVFVSWSGNRSEKLAKTLSDWLPAVLQHIKPYFTPNDIEKGARWSSEISNKLEESSIGIFCITPENTSSNWIHFEAGAIAKNLDNSKVCCVLFGLENTDLQGPLTQFQSSYFRKDDLFKLLKTINKSSGEHKLLDETLLNVFEMWWPKLEADINKVLETEGDSGNSAQRSDRDILEEVLEITRTSLNHSRHDGSSRTRSSYIINDIADMYFRFYRRDDSQDSQYAVERLLYELHSFLANNSGRLKASHRKQLDVPWLTQAGRDRWRSPSHSKDSGDESGDTSSPD